MFTKCQQNMRMRDFQVQCPAKTLRARGATSKTMQIRQKCTVLFPIETRDSSFFLMPYIFWSPRDVFLVPFFQNISPYFFFVFCNLDTMHWKLWHNLLRPIMFLLRHKRKIQYHVVWKFYGPKFCSFGIKSVLAPLFRARPVPFQNCRVVLVIFQYFLVIGPVEFSCAIMILSICVQICSV